MLQLQQGNLWPLIYKLQTFLKTIVLHLLELGALKFFNDHISLSSIMLENIQIPRCYFSNQAYVNHIELHGFCDASEKAYAGVVYLKSVDTFGTAHISLVSATINTKIGVVWCSSCSLILSILYILTRSTCLPVVVALVEVVGASAPKAIH